MKVSLVQSYLHWESPVQNLERLSRHLSACKNSDLVVLPEMFSTGFTMKPEQQAEKSGGPGLQWMQKEARSLGTVLTGSLSVEENGKYHNRLYWVDPQGLELHYDKRHLFRMAGEDKHYTPGHQTMICRIGTWKIMPLVCYDLRFPVWSRNRFDKNNRSWSYDVLLYVANWPAVRSYAWRQLLIARAIENQCYVIGVNRVGQDGNGFEHSGNSMVVGPRGEVLAELADGQEGVLNAELDAEALQKFREGFPAGLDADQFNVL